MASINIQSNALRGDYVRGIINKTIREIHDDIKTVFGPFAVEAYLTKDGQPYYTKDGLEVLQSMKFDNELSMYVTKILYQAVHDQGKKIGDGTTTLTMLYTNIYETLISMIEDEYSAGCHYELSVLRPIWNRTIKEIIKDIKIQAVPMSEEYLFSSLYTCTQDYSLAKMIYSNLHTAIMNESYITINKSNITTDFVTTIHNQPLFKVTKQFSVKPVKSTEERCVIYHCNGMLDIAHIETLIGLLSRTMVDQHNNTIPITYILLCNGLTNITRETTKKLIHELNKYNVEMLDSLNNIAIYTLDEYRSFTPDELEDISTIITNEKGVGGLVNSLSFESLLYQSLCNDNESIESVESLKTFDVDIHHIDKIRSMATNYYRIDFDDVEGMRIYKELGTIAQNRYNELRAEIEEEKSEVRKNVLQKRLRKMYGQFIEVEVGSKLLKDSQRKYELILDAIVSSMEGVRHGVIRTNSILAATKTIVESMDRYINFVKEKENPYVMLCYNVLLKSFYKTFIEMLDNSGCFDNTIEPSDFIKSVLNDDISNFNLSSINNGTSRISSMDDVLNTMQGDKKQTPDSIRIDDGTIMEVTTHITEPATIITNILENSMIPVELAMAKSFHLNSFMQNYI